MIGPSVNNRYSNILAKLGWLINNGELSSQLTKSCLIFMKIRCDLSKLHQFYNMYSKMGKTCEPWPCVWVFHEYEFSYSYLWKNPQKTNGLLIPILMGMGFLWVINSHTHTHRKTHRKPMGFPYPYRTLVTAGWSYQGLSNFLMRWSRRASRRGGMGDFEGYVFSLPLLLLKKGRTVVASWNILTVFLSLPNWNVWSWLCSTPSDCCV